MSARFTQLMPVTARHVGVWKGTFRRLDAQGNKSAEFASEVIFRLRDDSHWPHIYSQTNSYFGPDGEVVQTFDTLGWFDTDRIRYASDRVRGWAADDPLDEHASNALLFMEILYREAELVYEMAQISSCGQFRTRTVQFLRAGQTVQRTLIDEQFVTADWAAYDAERAARQ